MDLGIKGRTALVCASSKGLGRGCAEALAAEGVDLVLNARGSEGLEATAASIRDTYGVAVTTIAADITSEAGQAAVLAAAGDVDILVTNAGGPPPGMWTDWDRDDFIAASANIDTLDDGAAGMPIARERVENAGLEQVMSNSFGFGGTNATLIFRRYQA